MKFIYSANNSLLIQSMNALNVFSSVYIIIKNPTCYQKYVPHSLVCMSSAVFWRCLNHEMVEVIKVVDYTCVFASLLNTWYWSFRNERDIVITPSIIIVIYLFCMSTHYKNVNKQNLCVNYHCLTYLVANMGIAVTFS